MVKTYIKIYIYNIYIISNYVCIISPLCPHNDGSPRVIKQGLLENPPLASIISQLGAARSKVGEG